MFVDMDPVRIGRLVVDGDLVVYQTNINVTFEALSVHIRSGNFKVGNSSNPFAGNFTIRILGTAGSNYVDIDPLVRANKFIMVTGSLRFYGKKPATLNTFLTNSAMKNTSLLYLASSAGWKVGDTLALAPSFNDHTEYEEVTIVAINGNGNISISPPLTYNHYGHNSQTITTNEGTLDAGPELGISLAPSRSSPEGPPPMATVYTSTRHSTSRLAKPVSGMLC